MSTFGLVIIQSVCNRKYVVYCFGCLINVTKILIATRLEHVASVATHGLTTHIKTEHNFQKTKFYLKNLH